MNDLIAGVTRSRGFSPRSMFWALGGALVGVGATLLLSSSLGSPVRDRLRALFTPRAPRARLSTEAQMASMENEGGLNPTVVPKKPVAMDGRSVKA